MEKNVRLIDYVRQSWIGTFIISFLGILGIGTIEQDLGINSNGYFLGVATTVYGKYFSCFVVAVVIVALERVPFFNRKIVIHVDNKNEDGTR